MEPRLFFFCLADVAMIAAGVVYGWKFLNKRNYLLGFEWLVMAVSGTNFFFYAMTGSHALYDIAYFFDAFSRAFGFPIIAVAGLMAVTHRYKPSTRVDIGLFVLSSVGAFILVAVDAIAPAKPYFYLIMTTLYSVFLAYMVWRLLRAGQRMHALGLALVLVTSQAIASIYDFYTIPGDDDQHTLFYIAALSTWAFMLFEVYYAYCALERAPPTADLQPHTMKRHAAATSPGDR